MAVSDAAGALLAAGGELNLGTVRTESSDELHWNAGNRSSRSASTEVGSQINAGAGATLLAGQDIHARAAQVQATGALNVQAQGNVIISAGVQSQSFAEHHQTSSRSWLSRQSTTTARSGQQSQALGSEFGGRAVTITSGADTRISGSQVIADEDLRILAGRDLTIEAAQNTHSASSFQQTSKSGLGALGGLSWGKSEQGLGQNNTQTTAAASTVGSVGGNVTLSAGQAYTQIGSDVLTPGGDISITAQSVHITEARESSSQGSEQRFRQSGVSVGVGGGVVSAAQGLAQTVQATGNTDSSRMQALGAAAAALQAQALATQGQRLGDLASAQSLADVGKASGASISISLGSSKGQSQHTSQSDSARGSTVAAGGSVNITAGGAGQNSDITIEGSNIQAGHTTRLSAQGDVNLLAAANTTREQNRSQNSSASMGVNIQLGAGGGISATAGASAGKGQGTGSTTTHTNTQVSGQRVQIDSGGDTTLAGAVVSAPQVSANVGGHLTIESLQDSSRYQESSQNAGWSVSVPITGGQAGASVSAGKTNLNSQYSSVNEQSAIRAGDGGFDITVGGNTRLVGGAITSSEAAVQEGKNRLATGGALQLSDLNNSANFDASSVGIGVGISGGKISPSGVGLGSDKGSASSSTRAAISGMAGETQARTGDAASGLAPIFDKDRVQAEVNAQVTITQEFGRQAGKEVGDYAKAQYDKAKLAGDQEGMAAWAEGGANRVALHAAVGALSGGAEGALGAAAASAAAPGLEELQTNLKTALQGAGLSDHAASTIASAAGSFTAAGIGAVASGGSAAGAATAFNADMNNRQLHPSEKQRIKELAAEKARTTCQGNTDCEKQTNLYWSDMLERAAEGRIDTQEATQNQAYYNKIMAAAGTPGTEASLGMAERFFNDLGEAQRLLNSTAGTPILDAQGRPVPGIDGKPQTYFSATPAQRADPYGNIFPGGSPSTQAPVMAGKEQRDQARLVRLNTPSGQATPDTTLEETLTGMRLPAKGAGAAVQVTERNAATALAGTAKAAEEALLRSGGAFDKAGNPLLDMSKLTNEQKRVVGENLFGPNTVQQIVPDGQQMARMQGQGSNGIDELYKVNRPDVDYVSIEYKFVGQDNKTGAQVLGNTIDGKQGSTSWIGGSGRIENAVSNEADVRSVRYALEAGRLESWVITVRPDGSTAVQVLDALGKPKPTDTSKIILPNVNLSGAQK